MHFRKVLTEGSLDSRYILKIALANKVMWKVDTLVTKIILLIAVLLHM